MKVTKSELAELLGVTVAHVPRLVARGMPGPIETGGGRGRSSTFDPVPCLAWQRQQLALEGTGSSPRDAYLVALTARQNLELQVRRGELVLAADVAQEYAHVGQMVKARLRAVPESVAVQMAGAAAKGPAAVKALLLQKIDEALRELAKVGREV